VLRAGSGVVFVIVINSTASEKKGGLVAQRGSSALNTGYTTRTGRAFVFRLVLRGGPRYKYDVNAIRLLECGSRLVVACKVSFNLQQSMSLGRTGQQLVVEVVECSAFVAHSRNEKVIK
jgi:hypothetical protein